MTSKCFPWTRGGPAAKAVSSFSFLALALTLLAQPYSRLNDQLRSETDPQRIKQILSQAKPLEDDAEFRSAIRSILDSKSPKRPEIERLKGMLAVRAKAEGSPAKGKLDDPQKAAEGIRSSPLYHDAGAQQSSNWIGKAYKRFQDLLDRMNAPKSPSAQLPNVSPVGSWAVSAIWVVLGAALLFFVYLIFRNVRWRSRKAKKVGGLLDDDEPDRTADEWLQTAHELEFQGRYREAVRCLYLASLARLDEGGVARFLRYQTNWEHYHRIQASPKRPPAIDLLPTTKAFDRIWYGFERCGPEDVAQFRSAYQQVCDELRLQRSA